MKLRVCIHHFAVTRIAERKLIFVELRDFLAFMGDVDLYEITPARVRKYVAQTDFPHY